MGFLKKLFGIENNNTSKHNAQSTIQSTQSKINNTPVINSLNLSKDVALQQLNTRKELITSLCLNKDKLNNLTARVAVVLDFSGSMEGLYRDGTIQTLLDRLLPLAMKFDDNGELDIWLFHNDAIRLDGIKEENFYNYINKSKILKKYNMWGTEYAPVMKDVVEKYISEEPSNYPNLVVFITDGVNEDRYETEKIMKLSSQYPIFWQFVGIGSSDFPFLENLDEMRDRLVDNANFFAVNDLMKIDDNTLYNRLLKEYPEWLNKIERPNIKRNIVYKK